MRHHESNIQAACVRYFAYAYPQYRGLLFAVPNGGKRGAVTARIMKAEGVVSGVANLLLLVPNATHHALAIEMKTDKGRQSDAQKAWQQAVEAQGYRYEVVRSLTECIDLFTDYLTKNQ